MAELTLTADEERAVRHALIDLPKVCRFHGSDFERSGMQHSLPRCESCRIPFRAQVAWQAYTAAIDRRDDAEAERRQTLHRLANELRDGGGADQ